MGREVGLGGVEGGLGRWVLVGLDGWVWVEWVKLDISGSGFGWGGEVGRWVKAVGREAGLGGVERLGGGLRRWVLVGWGGWVWVWAEWVKLDGEVGSSGMGWVGLGEVGYVG